jgi:hypothetical protein
LLAAGCLTVRVAAGQPAAAAPGAATARSPSADSAVTTVSPERGRAVDAERDPGGGPRPTEPVFLEPMTTTTEHFRAGLSSWITPSAPFDNRQDPGGAAIGFTITWPPPRHDNTAPPAGPSAWSGSAAR